MFDALLESAFLLLILHTGDSGSLTLSLHFFATYQYLRLPVSEVSNGRGGRVSLGNTNGLGSFAGLIFIGKAMEHSFFRLLSCVVQL